MAVASDSTEIRGRIDTGALIQRLHRLPLVPQVERRRTINTPFNVILACALDRLPTMLTGGSEEELGRLNRLRGHWAGIERDIHDPVTSVIAAQWASPPGYRQALQLAKLILIGAVLDPASSMGGRVFTVSMARIWELGLRRMLDEICLTTDWQATPEAERSRAWDDSLGENDPSRWMLADAMVQQAGSRWVFDAKYKLGYGSEARADRFQMCAYALAFGADRVSLVHPSGGGSRAERRVLLRTTVGGKCITIDSMALPMADGPEACRQALESFFPPSWESDSSVATVVSSSIG
jgi:hypothetical protein